MPIFSRRFALWTRLYSRMILEPTSGAMVTPTVSEVVVPVIDADAILQTPIISSGTSDLSPTAGSVDVAIMTVPQDKEWAMLQVITNVTAAVSRLGISVDGGNMYLTSSGTGPFDINLRDYILRAGDNLFMLSTGSGSDSSATIRAAYMESDLST